tara:strand:+ start:1511 stop:1717 length:207 start_codon:yes stop_codon:yes gene_type:complete
MKSIFKSKVIWYNLLTIVTVIASVFGYTPDQQVADLTSGILLTLSPIVNILLRFFTTKGIDLSKYTNQ